MAWSDNISDSSTRFDKHYRFRSYSPSSSSSLHSAGHRDKDDRNKLLIIRPPSYASVRHHRHHDRSRRYTPSDPLSIASEEDHYGDEFEPSRLSSVVSYLVSPFMPRKTSIYGPTANAQERAIFLAIISLMTFCGANNDFLGKLCYQSLPGVYSGYAGLQNRYWIAWLLTAGTFLICAIAIVFGWNRGHEWKNAKKQLHSFLFYVTVAATCDVWVNGGRYVGLVFLPASVVTILKNGTQLLFSAVFRLLFEHKTLSKLQTLGIVLVVLGLLLVCVAIFLNQSASSSLMGIFIGICMLIAVGLFGSIRNHYEQKLCRDLSYNANFVVGVRSLVSLAWTLLIAVVLLSIPSLYASQHYDDDNVYRSGWLLIADGLMYVCASPVFVISFLLFLLAIYGKNITQMRVIELSSALTRNLLMQLMPIGTWCMSLIVYYIDTKYGEEWNDFSYIRLLGFIVVLCGSYLYMKIPKEVATSGTQSERVAPTLDLELLDIEKRKLMHLQTSATMASQVSDNVDLYDNCDPNDILLPSTPPSMSMHASETKH